MDKQVDSIVAKEEEEAKQELKKQKKTKWNN